MTQAQIVTLQKRIGASPDGFWGPKSMAACQRHLRAMMPTPNPWPKASQSDLQAYYGSPGNVLMALDVIGLGVRYEDKPVSSISVHPKCAGSLLRILRAIHNSSFAYVLQGYAGVFNNRKMRGGSLPSLHARGAAIDLMPGTNGNTTHWPTKANMPIEVMEFFAQEGWLSAGAFWGRDGMHHEATSR